MKRRAHSQDPFDLSVGYISPPRPSPAEVSDDEEVPGTPQPSSPLESEVPGTPQHAPEADAVAPAAAADDGERKLHRNVLCPCPDCPFGAEDGTKLAAHWRLQHSYVPALPYRAHFVPLGVAICEDCIMPFQNVLMHRGHCAPRLARWQARQLVEVKDDRPDPVPDVLDQDATALSEFVANCPPLLRSVPLRAESAFVAAASAAFAKLNRAATPNAVHAAVVDVCLLPRTLLRTGKGNKRAARIALSLRRSLDALKDNVPLHEILLAPADAQLSQQPGVPSTSQRARRARACFRSGAGLGQALQQLRNNGVADVADPQVFRKLLELHPIAPPLLLSDIKVPDSPPVNIAADDAFRKRVNRLPRGKAAGIDGWTNEMLFPLSGDAECLRGIALMAELFTNGSLSPVTLAMLNSGRLTAALKPDGAGVRPIVVDSVFVRLAKHIALAESRLEMRQALAPFDQSFTSRGGAERIAHLLRNALNSDGQMVVSFDITNAFNTRSRAAILQALFQAKSLSRLWRIAWATYAKPLLAFARGSDGELKSLKSFQGVRQGDHLGLLFALSLVPDLKLIQQRCPAVKIVSYQDNIYAIGAPDQCVKAVPVFRDVLAVSGSLLNMRKCEAVFFGGAENIDPALRNRMIDLGLRFVEANWLTLGVAISSSLPSNGDAARVAVQEAAAEHVKLLDTLADKAFSSQEAMLYLRCLASPAQVYAARTTPPDLFLPTARAVDEAVQRTVQSRLGLELTPTSLTQLRLPLRLGGLGLPSLESISYSAFVASLANAAPLFARLDVPILDSVLYNAVDSITNAAPATIEHLPPSRDEDLKRPDLYNERFTEYFSQTTAAGALLHPPIGLQKILFRSLQDRWHQGWRDQAATPFENRRITSLCRKLASAWLGVFPEDAETTIQDDQWSICVRHHLDLPLASVMPKNCACGAVLAAKSRCHLMTCKHQRGNGHIQRHDAVLKVIQNAINNAGGRAYVQVRDLSDAKRLRPDLECAIGDKNLLADVQVIHPATRSRLRQRQPTANAAREKSAKYRALYGEQKAHADFVPLIFETYGGFGKSARDFCSRVSEQAVASGFSSRRAVASLISRVAIAIQRGNARTVLLSLRNCGRLN